MSFASFPPLPHRLPSRPLRLPSYRSSHRARYHPYGVEDRCTCTSESDPLLSVVPVSGSHTGHFYLSSSSADILNVSRIASDSPRGDIVVAQHWECEHSVLSRAQSLTTLVKLRETLSFSPRPGTPPASPGNNQRAPDPSPSQAAVNESTSSARLVGDSLSAVGDGNRGPSSSAMISAGDCDSLGLAFVGENFSDARTTVNDLASDLDTRMSLLAVTPVSNMHSI
jgi:hypothetical protein